MDVRDVDLDLHISNRRLEMCTPSQLKISDIPVENMLSATPLQINVFVFLKLYEQFKKGHLQNTAHNLFYYLIEV